MKKKVIFILMMVVLIISTYFLVGCDGDVSILNNSASANCLIYTGYSDKFYYSDFGRKEVDYFYDNNTKVMYAYGMRTITPLYNADGTLVTYDEWLSNRTEENDNQN